MPDSDVSQPPLQAYSDGEKLPIIESTPAKSEFTWEKGFTVFQSALQWHSQAKFREFGSSLPMLLSCSALGGYLLLGERIGTLRGIGAGMAGVLAVLIAGMVLGAALALTIVIIIPSIIQFVAWLRSAPRPTHPFSAAKIAALQQRTKLEDHKATMSSAKAKQSSWRRLVTTTIFYIAVVLVGSCFWDMMLVDGTLLAVLAGLQALFFGISLGILQTTLLLLPIALRRVMKMFPETEAYNADAEAGEVKLGDGVVEAGSNEPLIDLGDAEKAY